MNTKIPVLFVGHGSPMNAIEDNSFTQNWAAIGEKIPKPKAILAVSAHWYTNGTRITDVPIPKQVYDMYGFPDALYRLVYQPHGVPELAQEVKSMLKQSVEIDNSWGLDHGAWSVLCKMFPKADIPVVQLSIDRNTSAIHHFEIGQQLRTLRENGILIVGSGNVVHNLSRIGWDMSGGYPWAIEFDGYIKEKILQKAYADVIHYQSAGESATLSFHTPEHFYPLLYILGASEPDDTITVFNDSCTMGSLSMTGYLFT